MKIRSRLQCLSAVVGLLLAGVGCNYYDLDAGGDIALDTPVSGTTATGTKGLPGDHCTLDEDCLNGDCDDARQICRGTIRALSDGEYLPDGCLQTDAGVIVCPEDDPPPLEPGEGGAEEPSEGE